MARRLLKIQYVSDLHLEFRKTNLRQIKPAGDVLVLAGDICIATSNEDIALLVEFLRIYSKSFLHVFHVAGNHEYYCYPREEGKVSTVQETNARLKNLTKLYPNYHYLNNAVFTFEFGGSVYNFAGTTLWTGVDKALREKLSLEMNDYRHIYYGSTKGRRPFVIEDMQRLHRAAVAFLTATKAGLPPAQKNILITHHKPVRDSPMTDNIIQMYESDTGHLLGAPFKLAIYGHTHKKYNKLVNGTRVVSNPRGYPREPTGFESDCVVRV